MPRRRSGSHSIDPDWSIEPIARSVAHGTPPVNRDFVVLPIRLTPSCAGPTKDPQPVEFNVPCSAIRVMPQLVHPGHREMHGFRFHTYTDSNNDVWYAAILYAR